MGKKYFSFKVLQKINTEELEKIHANIIEALLLMLESSYIKKFQEENIALYNIENTLEEIIKGNRELSIHTNIAINVLCSYYIKYKYVFNSSKNIFELKERDSILNIIKNNSTIRSNTRLKETEKIILNDLKDKGLYEKFTYSFTCKYINGNKQENKLIVELNEEGIKYLLNNYDFEAFRKKKKSTKETTNINKQVVNEKDKNTLKDLQKILLERKLLKENYSYDEFREILIT